MAINSFEDLYLFLISKNMAKGEIWNSIDNDWKKIFKRIINTTKFGVNANSKEPSDDDLKKLFRKKKLICPDQFQDIFFYSIPNLEDTIYFKDLRTLDCSGTYKSLDLTGISKLQNLMNLSLGFSELKSITPIKSLTKLTRLDLRFNRDLTDISPIENLIHIQHLDLSNTGIECLDAIKKLKRLKTIDISGTQIKSLKSLYRMKELREINLYHHGIPILVNQVELNNFNKANPNCRILLTNKFDREKHTKAYQINLKWFESLPISWKLLFMPLLKIRSLHDLIGQSQFNNLFNIKEFVFERNYFIPKKNKDIIDLNPLKRFKKLEKIIIQDASISDLSPLIKFENLRFLDLSNNCIIDISPLAYNLNLEVLDLSRNPIQNTEPLKNLMNLKELNLGYTPINTLEITKSILSIESLSLYDTQLKNYKIIGKMINLESLYLSSCQINKLSILENLKNLWSLSISNSAIVSFHGIENLTKLIFLDLNGTNLRDLNCIKSLINLYKLDISDNPIKSLEGLRDMTKLSSLSVSNTKITNFKGLENNENINIFFDGNEIDDFSHFENYNPSQYFEEETDYDYFDYDYNYTANENSYENSYCGSCESSPCMCSDKEKTSMTY